MKKHRQYDLLELPPKPSTVEGQVSMLWDIVTNDYPHFFNGLKQHIDWCDLKINFLLWLGGATIALVGIAIALLTLHIL